MAQANKHILMAALTYNLKKYLNFSRKKVQTGVAALQKGLEYSQNRFWSRFDAQLSVFRSSAGIQEKNTGRTLSATTAR